VRHFADNFGHLLLFERKEHILSGTGPTIESLESSAVTGSLLVYVLNYLTALNVVSRVAIQSIETKRVLEQTCRQFHLSVCL